MRFLLGGRHGDFKFLPPSGYAPCYEALLPKEKMKVEPVKEYKRDVAGVRDLLGTAQLLSQASFIPTPVETSQVKATWVVPRLNQLSPSSAPPFFSDYHASSLGESPRQAGGEHPRAVGDEQDRAGLDVRQGEEHGGQDSPRRARAARLITWVAEINITAEPFYFILFFKVIEH